MSLRAEPWWASCVDRVATESLEGLAVEFHVGIEDLAHALAEEGLGGPAQLAPWWPEAVRELEAGVSIRSVARRFRTEPRRIRRALARTAIRAGGTAFATDGLPALGEFLGRLGKEPDVKVAEAARVSIQAVQGERRRRGIPAYQQRRTRRAKLTADDMQWIRGPKRNRREKFKPEADVQVVRRPVRTELAPPPATVVRRSLDGDRGHFEASPRGEGDPRGDVPGRGTVRSTPWASRPSEDNPPQRSFERPWIKSERQEEIDQLLSVQRRQRDGRQRIVRADSQRPELSEPERSPRVVRRPAAAPGTTWRPVDPSVAPPSEPVPPPEPVAQPRRVEADREPVVRRVFPPPVVARPLPPAPPVVERPVLPAPPVAARSVLPAPPVVARPLPPTPPVAAPVPAPVEPPAVVRTAFVAPVEVPVAPRRVARPAAAEGSLPFTPAPPAPTPVSAAPPRAREPRQKAMVSQAPASGRPGHVEVLPPQVTPAATPAPGLVAWFVEAPGGEAAFVLYATDITDALIAASARLEPELLARACIWRVGEPRPTV